MASNEEIQESIRPLLRLSRETIDRLQKTGICPGEFSASGIRCWPSGSSG